MDGKINKGLGTAAAIAYTANMFQSKERRKIMNDIIYYSRKLMRLAKQAQALDESTDIGSDKLIREELERIEREIDKISN